MEALTVSREEETRSSEGDCDVPTEVDNDTSWEEFADAHDDSRVKRCKLVRLWEERENFVEENKTAVAACL